MVTVCKVCKHTLQYDEEYDAYYCEVCNKWKEKVCSDPTCTYCSQRPPRPLVK